MRHYSTPPRPQPRVPRLIPAIHALQLVIGAARHHEQRRHRLHTHADTPSPQLLPDSTEIQPLLSAVSPMSPSNPASKPASLAIRSSRSECTPGTLGSQKFNASCSEYISLRIRSFSRAFSSSSLAAWRIASPFVGVLALWLSRSRNPAYLCSMLIGSNLSSQPTASR